MNVYRCSKRSGRPGAAWRAWSGRVLLLGAALLPAHAAPARTAVLDTTGFWRIHHTLRPPVVAADSGVETIRIREWLDRETPPPPAGWHAADFDDRTWLRGPARIAVRTPYAARIAMRALFTVDDPAAVRDLRLSAAYHGGIVVVVNGREVARRHLPAGAIGPETLAEPYPREAFVDSGGALLMEWAGSNRSRLTREEDLRRLGLRERRLEEVAIPAGVLRRGVNVLAIEIVRAPYDAAIEELKYDRPERRRNVYNLPFNTCEVWHVQLHAAAPSGLSQEAVRPEGFQVWNSDVLTPDFDLDFAGPSERLYPVRLAGPRGAIVSGKVVVGSTRPIEGLRATLAPAIPSARIRYGIPWSDQPGAWGPRYTMWALHYSRSPREPTVFGALAEAPPDVVAVRAAVRPRPGHDLETPNQPEPVYGAVMPVWLTVAIPRDAPAGVHRAELRIEADGEEPRTVPVELVVADWTLPEASERRAWLELIQVPDTTALEYDVPLWSEEHWRLMARAFELIGETSSRVLYLPLIGQTNHGTAESMVRWIRQPDGSWRHDFSILERYLDTATRHMGRPEMVVLYAWELYQIDMARTREPSNTDGAYQERRALEAIRDGSGPTGPLVTTQDASGETGTTTLPFFDAPESRRLWGPLFARLRAILEPRGLWDTAVLGSMSDVWPTREELEALGELTGGLPWVKFSHLGARGWRAHETADIRYQGTVCMNRFADDDPPMGSHHGWAGPNWPRGRGVPVAQRLEEGRIFALNDRGGRGYDIMPPARLRLEAELNITGDQRGSSRIGADYWAAVRDRRGRRSARPAARFPQSSWRNQDLASSMLAPGPDGPVSTPGFEALREGYQEAEARIVIEAALVDEASRARLGEALAARCEAVLVERTQLMLKGISQMMFTGADRNHTTFNYHYWYGSPNPIGSQWFLGSDWQRRSEELFYLAGEVARRLR